MFCSSQTVRLSTLDLREDSDRRDLRIRLSIAPASPGWQQSRATDRWSALLLRKQVGYLHSYCTQANCFS